MSNCLLNISFGNWHFQLRRNRPFVRIARNRHVSRPWHRIIVHPADWTPNADSYS